MGRGANERSNSKQCPSDLSSEWSQFEWNDEGYWWASRLNEKGNFHPHLKAGSHLITSYLGDVEYDCRYPESDAGEATSENDSSPIRSGDCSSNPRYNQEPEVHQALQVYGNASSSMDTSTKNTEKFGWGSLLVGMLKRAISSNILFVSAGAYDLDIHGEKTGLEEVLSNSTQPEMFNLVVAESVRPDTLGPILRRTDKMSIMHFSGHGDKKGDFAFWDKNGKKTIVKAKALGDLLELAKENGLKLAVLNSCYSHKNGQYIANKVGMAVGMRGIVNDDAAIAFTNAFYRALVDFNITWRLNSEVVKKAFEWAEKELRMSFDESAGSPVLFQ
jgi:hypothetical protein